MAKQIITDILITASTERVWSVLTAFEKYPEWNPFVRSVKGNVKKGAFISVFLQPPGEKGMTFKPEVLIFEKEKEFTWKGRLLLPGIFDGEHTFRIEDLGNGTCRFIQSEKFNGILVPFLSKMLDGSTVQGFKAMNQKLKELCEERF